MEDIQVIMADIDGTLVNEAREMTPLTLEVLETLHRQGILFGIASGRPLSQLEVNAQRWGLPFECDFIIGMNGAELRDLTIHREQQFYLLKREWIREIMDMMEPFDADANPYLYFHGTLLCGRIDEAMQRSMERSGQPCHAYEKREDCWKEENAKIMFRIEDESRVPEILNYIEEHPSPNYRAFLSQPTMIEFMDSRINKGMALEKLCEDHDFTLADIAAFGDTSNDNEMLEAAGLGVRLINGTDDTKACADEITEYDNDHDGFARYILKKFPQYFTEKQRSQAD